MDDELLESFDDKKLKCDDCMRSMKKIKDLGSFEKNKKRCNNCKEYFEENNYIEAFHAKEKTNLCLDLCLDCYLVYGDYVIVSSITSLAKIKNL